MTDDHEPVTPAPQAKAPVNEKTKRRTRNTPRRSRSAWSLLYNSNPFYFISALLVLAGIRFAYGEIPAGSLNCWGMLGVLAAYTTAMATAAIVVIRFGKVWDDARSILVTLVLLFVAMSVSFDELLVIDPDQAFALTVAGWAFAVGVSEAVLLLTRIRLQLVYRIPFHAAISLLLWFPYFASPELTEFTRDETEWRLLLFPALAAVVMLALIPAVWLGRRSTEPNSTPWRWPVYPWALFIFLAVVCVIRSYVLTLSFGPSDGWETSFGLLHVLPMIAAISLLLIEASARHHHRLLPVAAMASPLVIVALIFIDVTNQSAAALLHKLFRDRVCEPTTGALAVVFLLYAWAWVRRLALADVWAVASALAVILVAAGEQSLVIPLATAAAGMIFAAIGAATRSAFRMIAGGALVSSVWYSAPLIEPFASLRISLIFHTALACLMIIGPVRGGRVGHWIETGVLVAFVAAGFAAFVGYDGRVMTPDWSISYIGSLACVCFVYGRVIDDRRFAYATRALAVLWLARVAVSGFRLLMDSVGPRAAIATIGGLSSFAIGGWISLTKSKTYDARQPADYSAAAAD